MTTRTNPEEITGTLGSVAAGNVYKYRKGNREYPQELLVKTSGGATATFHVEVSDPDRDTWTQATDVDGTQLSYTNDIAFVFKPPASMDIRIACSAYTSGTITYRIAAG